MDKRLVKFTADEKKKLSDFEAEVKEIVNVHMERFNKLHNIHMSGLKSTVTTGESLDYSASEKITSLQKKLKELSDEHKKELDEFCTRFRRRNWIFLVIIIIINLMPIIISMIT